MQVHVDTAIQPPRALPDDGQERPGDVDDLPRPVSVHGVRLAVCSC